MNAYSFSLTVTLILTYSNAVQTDHIEDQLQCIKSCRTLSNRLCLQPPDVCGNCLQSFQEIRGMCKANPDLKNDLVLNKATYENEKEIKETKFISETAKRKDLGIDLAVNGNYDNQSYIDQQQQQSLADDSSTMDAIFIAVIVAVSAAALVGIIVAVICWCKLKKSSKEVSDYEYPEYGSMDGQPQSFKSTSGDRKLALSAQMYHFQHQKEQMLELEKSQNAVSKSGSDHSTDDESPDDDYTVYECPGLATTDQIEVPNPLFTEPPLPSSDLLYPELPPPVMNGHEPEMDHHSVNGLNGPKEH